MKKREREDNKYRNGLKKDIDKLYFISYYESIIKPDSTEL